MSLFDDSDEQRSFDRTLAKRLFALLAPRSGIVVVAFIIAGLAAGSPARSAMADWLGGQVRLLADNPTEATDALGLICLGIVVCRDCQSAGWRCANLVNSISESQTVLHDLRQTLMGRLLRLPARTTVRQPVGRLLTRAVNDPSAINDFIGGVLVELVRDLIMIIGCAVVLLIMDWRLFLVAAASIPLLVGVGAVFRAVVSRQWRGTVRC